MQPISILATGWCLVCSAATTSIARTQSELDTVLKLPWRQTSARAKALVRREMRNPTWERKASTYCSGNWHADWAAHAVQPIADCKNTCAASANCVAITVGTYRAQANICVLCTSSAWAADSWTTTYEKQAPAQSLAQTPTVNAYPREASMCQNGILKGDICCAASCGTCGGSGCTKRPGGASQCCTGSIKSTCTSSSQIACKVPQAQPYDTPIMQSYCSANWRVEYGQHTQELSVDACKARCSASSTCVAITFGRSDGNYPGDCVLCGSSQTSSFSSWDTYVKQAAKDNDYCLQQSSGWGASYVCSGSTTYCHSYAKDMQRCCPQTCGNDELTETECNALKSHGTCVYPRPTQEVETDAHHCSSAGLDRYNPDKGGCCSGLVQCIEARPTTDAAYCAPNHVNHNKVCWSEIVMCRDTCGATPAPPTQAAVPSSQNGHDAGKGATDKVLGPASSSFTHTCQSDELGVFKFVTVQSFECKGTALGLNGKYCKAPELVGSRTYWVREAASGVMYIRWSLKRNTWVFDDDTNDDAEVAFLPGVQGTLQPGDYEHDHSWLYGNTCENQEKDVPRLTLSPEHVAKAGNDKVAGNDISLPLESVDDDNENKDAEDLVFDGAPTQENGNGKSAQNGSTEENSTQPSNKSKSAVANEHNSNKPLYSRMISNMTTKEFLFNAFGFVLVALAVFGAYRFQVQSGKVIMEKEEIEKDEFDIAALQSYVPSEHIKQQAAPKPSQVMGAESTVAKFDFDESTTMRPAETETEPD